MNYIVIGALALFITSPFPALAQKPSTIKLTEIDCRTWLISPDGKPFFAHGITHAGLRQWRGNYQPVSKACKDLGFNACGYGCPNEQKSDIPYMMGLYTFRHRVIDN